MDTNPSFNRGLTLPVESVTWEKCQEFISRLNDRVGGQRIFLPTFAQWQYSMRPSEEEHVHVIDDAAQMSRYAWYADNEGFQTHPVGELQPSAWGLYDMLGNVEEWTAADTKSTTANESDSFEICGGHILSDFSFLSKCLAANISNRGGPNSRDFTIGFRVAREYSEDGRLTDGGLNEITLVNLEEVSIAQPPVSGTYRIHVPVQRIDVLHDRVEADGEFATGFQVARSMWDDILEGKVLYDADPLHERVLTASAVFSQMQRNITDRQAENRILRVTADQTDFVAAHSQLWPSVKQQMTSFLSANDDWEVLLPDQPVTFYEEDEPLYEMYAWFEVHPESGRMVGRLPNGTGGGIPAWAASFYSGFSPDALNDSWDHWKGQLPDKFADAPGGTLISSNPAGGYFNRLSGMYVAAAGVIDGIAVLISNPSLADTTPAELQKFLAMHSLDEAALFLEQHATMYDSYAAQAEFWHGAVLLPAALGGEEAMRDAANRAIESARNKARADAEASTGSDVDLDALADALTTLLNNSGVEWSPSIGD